MIALVSGLNDAAGNVGLALGPAEAVRASRPRKRARRSPGPRSSCPSTRSTSFARASARATATTSPSGDGGFAAGVDRATAGRIFSRFYLLPAIQVDTPAKADVVLTVGVDPHSLGVPLGPRREVLRRQLLRRAGAALTGSLAGLLVANALYLVIGVALLPLLRDRAHADRARGPPRARRTSLGVAATGALSAHLALIGVPVGLPELVVSRSRRRPGVAAHPHASRRRQVTLCHLAWEGSPSRRASIGIAAFVARARAARARDARVLGAAARRVGRLGDLGDEGARAVRLRRRRSRRLHDAAVRAAAASAAAARARGDRLPRDGRLRRNAHPRPARAARLRVRGGAVDAAARARAGGARRRGDPRDRRGRFDASPTRRRTSPTSRWRSSSRSASSRSHGRCSTERSGLLPFAAIMLGAATLTKPEGLLFAAAALVPFVLIARTRASLLTAARRRADPAAVAHLRRRPRPEEPRVQLRRRARARRTSPTTPIACGRPSGVSGTRSGRAAGACSCRSRSSPSPRPCSHCGWRLAGVRGRLGAALVRGHRARLLDLGRPDRADAEVGRVSDGRITRHRRCSAGAATRRRGLERSPTDGLGQGAAWPRRRIRRTKQLARRRPPKGHARAARLTVCLAGNASISGESTSVRQAREGDERRLLRSARGHES